MCKDNSQFIMGGEGEVCIKSIFSTGDAFSLEPERSGQDGYCQWETYSGHTIHQGRRAGKIARIMGTVN